MTKIKCGKTITICGLIVFFIAILSPMVFGDPSLPRTHLPAAITSLGQSPDAFTTNVLARRGKLNIKYNNLLPAKEVRNYKTLLLCVGASLKGFGSAGVNLDTEIDRGKEIIKAAKDNHVVLVVLHTGGEGRREQMSNKLLDTVADRADALIVLRNGNKDGYFDKIAAKNNIPLVVVDKILELQNVLKKMFL